MMKSSSDKIEIKMIFHHRNISIQLLVKVLKKNSFFLLHITPRIYRKLDDTRVLQGGFLVVSMVFQGCLKCTPMAF